MFQTRVRVCSVFPDVFVSVCLFVHEVYLWKSDSRFLPVLFSFLRSAAIKEAPADFPPPVKDERREAGEQTEEPSAEAAERCQEAA